MNFKILLILLIGVTVIVFFGNFSPVATMMEPVQTLYTSMATATLAGEAYEIQDIVNEFLVLRSSGSSEKAEKLAAELDRRINNLQLVKMHCNQNISSAELANEKNPYEKLQQLCPGLKNMSFSKATQLFRLI